MAGIELTSEQKRLALAPIGEPRTLFLQGPAGCGKTTLAVHRLHHLLNVGARADRLLVWVPQRSLGRPYIDALRSPAFPAGPRADVLSIDGLARRMIDLFWVLIAARAGFDAASEPRFLTLETSQYFMSKLLEPLVGQGRFGDIALAQGRLISQILDNLNKSALVGFPHTEIASRLAGAWNGASGRARVYEAAQEAAHAFRTYCLQNSLLDFSLQLDTFTQYVWPLPACRAYLQRKYRHLIADNVEEDVPVAHDLLREWIAQADSSLLVYDQGGGFRTYLGADSQGGLELARLCDQREIVDTSFVSSDGIRALTVGLMRCAPADGAAKTAASPVSGNLQASLETIHEHFHTDLLRTVCAEVASLVNEEGASPREIAIVAPFVDDALRFALIRGLAELGVPVRSHRPSRALRDEPAVRCLLTFACLAHPHWEMCPPNEDVAQALLRSIADLDWVRADYLTGIVYRKRNGKPRLTSFEKLNAEAQTRITYLLGARFSALREWLDSYRSEPPVVLDIFWSALFDELLTRPGFGFAGHHDAAAATASLIESARKFRWALGEDDPDELGKRYIGMVQEGVVAAQYLHGWQPPVEDAVFIGPAYTFLTENRPVQFQFWLNVNSPSWGRRVYQPLTHPFVLTRHWPVGRKWLEADEAGAGQAMLQRVVVGLLRRCRSQVYMCTSHLSARGFEERGPLLGWVQRLLRREQRAREARHV